MIKDILQGVRPSIKEVLRRFERLTDMLDGVDAEKITPQFLKVRFKKAGLDSLYSDYRKIINENLRKMDKEYIEKLREFVGNKKTREQTNQLFTIAGQNLQAGVSKIKRVANAVSIVGTADILVKNIKRQASYIETDFDLDLSNGYRQYNNSLAEENGVKIFRYAGVSDSLTRPFCANALGLEPRTIEEWNKLDNGKSQPDPVSTNCGGYRCRHYLAPVIVDEEEETKPN